MFELYHFVVRQILYKRFTRFVIQMCVVCCKSCPKEEETVFEQQLQYCGRVIQNCCQSFINC